jgi:aerobic carbon-monoxide dehydrogenase large subunit
MPLLGTAVRRVEDAPLLVGEGRFVADVDLPGCLHVAYVTATVAHARITHVDVEAARAAPGVVDVVTPGDIELPPLSPISPDWPVEMARPLLATDVVRFVGEPLVAIVAETAEDAADAAELVVVEVDPLPSVIGFDAALAGDVLLFPDARTNVVARPHGGADGDLPFDSCEVVVEATFENQRLAPCPIETRVAASLWTDDGRLVQYASCQGAHPIRTQLANVYGLETDQVRVITQDVGGSFGAKGRAYPEDLLLPLLAKRSGRPVRWTPPRSDDMVGLGHSRAQRQRVRIGGDRDGTIRCLEVELLIDCGAYPVNGPLLVGNTGALLPGPYAIEHVRWHATAVVTNTTPLVAYRGAGRPEAAALVDRAVDVFAAEARLDPIDVRRKNLIAPEAFPWSSPTGLTYDSGDYVKALDLALALVDVDAVRAEQAARRERHDTRVVGIGTSVFIDRTAGIKGSEYGAVTLRRDGSILVHTGSSPYGQGHYTAWAMLVADRTGLPLDRIEVFHGDTDVVPRGGVTGGSRSAQKAGSAIAEASDALVVEARRLAANLLEAAEDDVVLDVGRAEFHVVGAPWARTISWVELAGELADDGPGLKCEADFAGEGPTFPFGAYVAVVEVDIETGSIDLRRIVTVDDAGTILNPMLALGQVHGGLAQGLAQALFEEFVYDDDGNPRTATFADYMLPTAADLPGFESYLTETPSPNNPMGFKGIAESGTIGGPPVVQNAVVDALSHLGVRHLDLPLTPERVWRAIPR